MSAELINAWIISYRSYTGAQLATEKANLQRWLSTPYDAQTQGSKSYQKNQEALALRLSALQRVLNETSGASPIGIMDASGGIMGGLAASQLGLGGFPNSTDW